MKVKANTRIEGIFAQAVAMDNRGMKNTIHGIGSNIYIVNFDYSMILRFTLRQSEISFDSPISFNANEYDSSEFTFKEGKKGSTIIFHTSSKEYQRKKICQVSSLGPTAKDIHHLYQELLQKGEKNKYSFYLSNECCPLLEDDLSHTEISVENSTLILRQRNVYSGTIIEIENKNDRGFFTVNKLPKNMPPIALKTKDFISLFNMYKSLMFIPTDDFIMVRENAKKDFDGILSLCRYDMIIDLYKGGNDNGRKEQEKRTSEQKVNRTTKKTKLQRNH